MVMEMGNYPVLTRGQEIELFKRIEETTIVYTQKIAPMTEEEKEASQEIKSIEQEIKDAKHEMIMHNLPLVIYIAKQYRDFGVPFEDLIQEGNFALLRAVDHYDLKKNTTFSTYAIASIRKAIYRALKKLNRANRIGSLDETISDNGSSLEYIDSIPDSRALLPEENSELVKNENEECIRNLLVSQLDERSEGIIISRYWEGKILKKIGQEYGVSKERARQVQDRALKQLKESVEAAGYG